MLFANYLTFGSLGKGQASKKGGPGHFSYIISHNFTFIIWPLIVPPVDLFKPTTVFRERVFKNDQMKNVK